MNTKQRVEESSTMAILLQLRENKILFHKNPVGCRCEVVTQDLSFRITKFIDSQVTYSITLFGIFYLLYKLFTNCWTMPEIILTLIAHNFTLIYMVTPPIYINLSYIFHRVSVPIPRVFLYREFLSTETGKWNLFIFVTQKTETCFPSICCHL